MAVVSSYCEVYGLVLNECNSNYYSVLLLKNNVFIVVYIKVYQLNIYIYRSKSSQYGLYILGRIRVTKVATKRYKSLSLNKP